MLSACVASVERSHSLGTRKSAHDVGMLMRELLSSVQHCDYDPIGVSLRICWVFSMTGRPRSYEIASSLVVMFSGFFVWTRMVFLAAGGISVLILLFS